MSTGDWAPLSREAVSLRFANALCTRSISGEEISTVTSE